MALISNRNAVSLIVILSVIVNLILGLAKRTTFLSTFLSTLQSVFIWLVLYFVLTKYLFPLLVPQELEEELDMSELGVDDGEFDEEEGPNGSVLSELDNGMTESMALTKDDHDALTETLDLLKQHEDVLDPQGFVSLKNLNLSTPEITPTPTEEVNEDASLQSNETLSEIEPFDLINELEVESDELSPSNESFELEELTDDEVMELEELPRDGDDESSAHELEDFSPSVADIDPITEMKGKEGSEPLPELKEDSVPQKFDTQGFFSSKEKLSTVDEEDMQKSAAPVKMAQSTFDGDVGLNEVDSLIEELQHSSRDDLVKAVKTSLIRDKKKS